MGWGNGFRHIDGTYGGNENSFAVLESDIFKAYAAANKLDNLQLNMEYSGSGHKASTDWMGQVRRVSTLRRRQRGGIPDQATAFAGAPVTNPTSSPIADTTGLSPAPVYCHRATATTGTDPAAHSQPLFG